MPDTRPLHRRKRVWVGGAALALLGVLIGTSSQQAHVTRAGARVTARPTVTATATVRTTVTVTPAPAPTVTKTVRVTVTAHAPAGSGTSGGSSGGGAASAPRTCGLRSSSGNCYRAGEFCPAADLGRTTTDADGAAITCETVNGYHRWVSG